MANPLPRADYRPMTERDVDEPPRSCGKRWRHWSEDDVCKRCVCGDHEECNDAEG